MPSWSVPEPVTRVCDERAPVDDAQEALACVGCPLDGRWRLVRLLGVGGTAAVYEAVDRGGRRVAIKVLSRRWMSPGKLLIQAAREAALTRAVAHPGVVEVASEALTEDGRVYLTMELLEGETLDERRQLGGGKLAPEEVLPVADALLDVVAAAHDRGIVHHDIKPGNVFLTSSGGVKLIDFGLARTDDEGGGAGTWFGTPGFVGPEQARGGVPELDRRADVWGIGATLFVVLSGQSVHPALRPEEEVALAASCQARSLGEAAPDLPAHVVEVVDRALAFDREARWPDVRSLRAALRGPAAATVPPPRPSESGVYPIGSTLGRRDELVRVARACAW